MKWALGVAAAALLAGGAVLAGIPLILVVMAGGAAHQSTDCLPGMVAGPDGWTGAVPAGATVPGMTPTQIAHAATVVGVGERMGVGAQGIVVALATVSQESSFLNYANDGRGTDLQPDQRDVGASMRLPHDAVGTDHGSLGLFQQQYPWWGSVEELMDPATTARLFYEALVKVPGWHELPVTVAAQRVQASAYPSAYADDEPVARQLLSMLSGAADTNAAGTVVNAGLDNGQIWCGLGGADGQIIAGDMVFPLPAGSFTVSSGFGPRANPTGGGTDVHTGLDFSAPAGTPVFALADGVVTTAMHSDVSYGNRVVIEHTPTMHTLYAHMLVLSVTEGQVVTAGQPIGQVGSTGRSTGNHLHFEVRMNATPIDPLPFLVQVGLDPNNPGMPQQVTGSAGLSGTDPVRMVTYNVHYGRNPAAVGAEIRTVITRSQASIICLQEASVAARTTPPPGWQLIQPRVANARGNRVPSATPLLIDTRVWQVAGTGLVPLTGYTRVGEAGAGPALASRRDLVLAHLVGPPGRLTAGCTHFTASKHVTQARAQLWRTQATTVAATLARLPAAGLVGGDFNADPRSSWLDPIARVAQVNVDTGPTLGGGRIDLVWGVRMQPRSAQTLPRLGSDHRPVVTVWTPTSAAAA